MEKFFPVALCNAESIPESDLIFAPQKISVRHELFNIIHSSIILLI